MPSLASGTEPNSAWHAYRHCVCESVQDAAQSLGIDPLEDLADVLPIRARDIRLADMSTLLAVHWKARRDAAKSS